MISRLGPKKKTHQISEEKNWPKLLGKAWTWNKANNGQPVFRIKKTHISGFTLWGHLKEPTEIVKSTIQTPGEEVLEPPNISWGSAMFRGLWSTDRHSPGIWTILDVRDDPPSKWLSTPIYRIFMNL